MLNFLKDLFDDNAKEIKRLQRIVEEINGLETAMASLSDEELQNKTAEFKQSLETGKSLDELLPQAFAVCREAAKRVLNMRHYDVQLVGGIVLHQGRIAEMKTGEGKTLVATLPVYLNALTGRGVHVITVNDYLAKRDSEWMGQLYKFLGLSTGLIVHGLDREQRRQAYAADITYGTNNEFGFDLMRDNMAVDISQLVQRELNYAIIDEVDSILIDEARTPLLISSKSDKPTELYAQMAKVPPILIKDTDYTVDEKAHTVLLTEDGVTKAEELFGIENLYDEANMDLNHHLNQALKAYCLMTRDRDYVIRDNEVVIVDQFTGRLMFGRRYRDGLHQAIEAKEDVPIQNESQTLATITFQNYFRMYKKLAGMTGTAFTEEEEFRKIYGLEVIEIPSNKPMIRQDLPDAVYKTEKGKLRAVVEEVERRYQAGQPVLVGTISIDKSEFLSGLLKRKGVPHKVLNAKLHDQEADIVALAGRYKAVTIATNMAGRGTDILLGGNPVIMAKNELHKKGLTIDEALEEFQQLLAKFKQQCSEENSKVLELGGLHIIGTERHDSRRIDNQLRGRAGRQGDPGSSQFYVSMEDDLMRLFKPENVTDLMERLGVDEDTQIENVIITKSIESAQKRVEEQNFKARKHLLEYDDVMNQQRKVIYGQRFQVLSNEDISDNIKDTIKAVVERSVDIYCPEGVHEDEWDLNGLLEYARTLYLPGRELEVTDYEEVGQEGLKQELLEKAMEVYQKCEEEIGSQNMREVEKSILLRLVDSKWVEHLSAMDQLRDGVGLRGYGSKNPLTEYKFESLEMFNNLIAGIQDDLIRYLFRVKINDNAKAEA